MRTLFIDADACPVTRDAIAVARRAGVKVVVVGNETQNLGRLEGRSGVETLGVPSGRDSADFAIVERLMPQDIVLTGDIGLAAMVLGRGARALSPRGRVYSPVTIEAEMEVRHAEQKLRRSGGRTRGPSPFDEDDRERFVESLERLLGEGRQT